MPTKPLPSPTASGRLRRRAVRARLRHAGFHFRQRRLQRSAIAGQPVTKMQNMCLYARPATTLIPCAGAREHDTRKMHEEFLALDT